MLYWIEFIECQEMATYKHWSVSLWRDPDDVPHCRILSPDKTEWCLILATLCGWRRCFVVDQLWFMTRIEEEDWMFWCSQCLICSGLFVMYLTLTPAYLKTMLAVMHCERQCHINKPYVILGGFVIGLINFWMLSWKIASWKVTYIVVGMLFV